MRHPLESFGLLLFDRRADLPEPLLIVHEPGLDALFGFDPLAVSVYAFFGLIGGSVGVRLRHEISLLSY